MGNCSDCKHWEPASGLPVPAGVCRLISSYRHSDGPPEKTKAHAMNEDGYWRGYLLTVADFGCVQHEANV